MAAAHKDKLQGRYANYFKIGQNAFEFVVDFGQHYGEEETLQLHTRIVTSPVYAKRLLATLQEAVSRHEATFGKVVNE